MVTFNGVSTNNLPRVKKPTGFTDPTVTPVTGENLWQWPNTLYVDRATVYDADKATTLGNIINDNAIGLKKQCTDLLSLFENTINTVSGHAELLDVNINLDPAVPTSDFYLDVDDKYVCPVIIYAKIVVE